MGVLNVTPDSFSDGGEYNQVDCAIDRAREMIALGVDIIDIGGESTRPGAMQVSEEEEIARTTPVVEALSKEEGVLLSIDTSKAAVAKSAISAGVHIVNDVTGLLGDPEMVEICLKSDVGIVIMHMQGTPQTMQQEPCYSDVVAEVRAFFTLRYEELLEYGISRERLCFDPGIGFGKTVQHNLTLLKNLSSLQVGDRPLLLGVSRKSFLGKILKEEDPKQRDWPTVGLTAYAATQGVHIHRVHDVKSNMEALRMMEAIREV